MKMATDTVGKQEIDDGPDITQITADELKDLDSEINGDDNPPDSSDSSTASVTFASTHQTHPVSISEIKRISKPKSRQQKRAKILQIVTGISGNVLEWYDFAVFGCLADDIGKCFLPPHGQSQIFSNSFAIFGIALFTRPTGGMVIGYIGDKYGRKSALEISIFLTVSCTVLLGMLPTYDSIGLSATFLFVLLRLVHGFAIGGLVPSSLVFTLENQSYENWGLYGGYVMASANIGALLGNFFGTTIKLSINNHSLSGWGWRIPYLSAILVVLPGLYLRYYCRDYTKDNLGPVTPGWNSIAKAFEAKNLRALLSASLVPCLWAHGFYITFIWMPTFLEDNVGFDFLTARVINNLDLFASCCVFFPLAGLASDTYGKKRVMFCGARYLFFGSPAAVVCLGRGKIAATCIGQIALGICLSMWGAPMMAWLVESFPVHVRLTSVSIGYNIAMFVFAGFSYAITTCLTNKFGNETPGFIISFVAVLAMIGLYFRPRRRRDQTPCDECETLCF